LDEERRLGLSDITFHSAVSYEKMPNEYDRADIFIAPSKPTPTYDEQYCTALLEAQAAGLPIVTTRTGGIPENIGDAGILVKPGDVSAITKAVKSFILNPKKRLAYGKKARRRAETVHDIAIGARKLSDLYHHLLS
jgi:glycosyltransferase involved in cell wall biosynthesis